MKAVSNNETKEKGKILNKYIIPSPIRINGIAYADIIRCSAIRLVKQN